MDRNTGIREIPSFFPVFRTMSAQGSEFINASMKPYLDEYHSVTDNMVPRFDSLDKEFASLVEGNFDRHG